MKTALGGAKLFNPGAAQLDLPGASADYKNLFALYSGLNSLYALATAASGKRTSPACSSASSRAPSRNGMAQLQTYLGQTSFSKLKLASRRRPAEPDLHRQHARPGHQLRHRAAQHDRRLRPPWSRPSRATSPFTLTAQLGSGRADQPCRSTSTTWARRRARWATSIAYMNGQLQAAGVLRPLRLRPDRRRARHHQRRRQVGHRLDRPGVVGPEAEHQPGRDGHALGADHRRGGLRRPDRRQPDRHDHPSGKTTVAPDAQSQLLEVRRQRRRRRRPRPSRPSRRPTSSRPRRWARRSARCGPPPSRPDGSVYVLANVNATHERRGAAPAARTWRCRSTTRPASCSSPPTSARRPAPRGLSLAVSADGSQVAVAGQVTGSLTAGPDGQRSDRRQQLRGGLRHRRATRSGPSRTTA